MMLRLQEAATSSSPVPSVDDYSSDTSLAGGSAEHDDEPAFVRRVSELR